MKNWIGTFTSRDNEEYTITIEDDAITADKTLRLVPDSIVLDYSLDSFTDGVLSTTLSFSVIDDGSIESIFLGECLVTLTKGSTVIWKGRVSQTAADMQAEGHYDEIEVSCVDLLTNLKKWKYSSVNGEPTPNDSSMELTKYHRVAQTSVEIFQRCARVAGLSRLQIETETITMSEQAFLPQDWTDTYSGDWLYWSDVLQVVAKATGSIAYVWGDTLYIDSAISHSTVCTQLDSDVKNITISSEPISATLYVYSESWSSSEVTFDPLLNTLDLRNVLNVRNLTKSLSMARGYMITKYMRTDSFDTLPSWTESDSYDPEMDVHNDGYSASPFWVEDGDKYAELNVLWYRSSAYRSKYYRNHNRSGISGNIGWYWSGDKADAPTWENRDKSFTWTQCLCNYISVFPIYWPVAKVLRPIKCKMFATYADAPDDWNASLDFDNPWTVNGQAAYFYKGGTDGGSNWINVEVGFPSYDVPTPFNIVMDSTLIDSSIHIFVKDIEYADTFLGVPQSEDPKLNHSTSNSVDSDNNLLNEYSSTPYCATFTTATHQSPLRIMRDVYGTTRKISNGDVFGIMPQPLRVCALNGVCGTITASSANIQGGYSTISAFHTTFKAWYDPWTFVAFSGSCVIYADVSTVPYTGGRANFTVRFGCSLRRNTSSGVETADFYGTVEQLKSTYGLSWTCNYAVTVMEAKMVVDNPEEYCSMSGNVMDIFAMREGCIDDVDIYTKATVTDGTHSATTAESDHILQEPNYE